ncbi:MAG: hypothetical protein HY904_06240 [Deltaproteobacteria bacterium]|nr:hypothetical protein [Deltaproteobacteria bacterium]
MVTNWGRCLRGVMIAGLSGCGHPTLVGSEGAPQSGGVSSSLSRQVASGNDSSRSQQSSAGDAGSTSGVLTASSHQGGGASSGLDAGTAGWDAAAVAAPRVDLVAVYATRDTTQNLKLKWATENAASCVATGDWTGTRAVHNPDATHAYPYYSANTAVGAGGGSTDSTRPAGTRTFGLSCVNPAGVTASDDAVVTVTAYRPWRDARISYFSPNSDYNVNSLYSSSAQIATPFDSEFYVWTGNTYVGSVDVLETQGDLPAEFGTSWTAEEFSDSVTGGGNIRIFWPHNVTLTTGTFRFRVCESGKCADAASPNWSNELTLVIVSG